MNSRILYAVFASLAALPVLAGCSGGLGGPTGRAVLTIQWPDRSRLIPTAANSIQVTISLEGQVLASRVIPRPQGGGATTVPFESLKVGSLSMSAIAYPNADATGVAQAQGTIPLSIQADQTTNITLTMESTIDHLEIGPAHPVVTVGKTTGLTVTAKDSSGRIVLIWPDKIEWQSADTTLASVDASGSVKAGSAPASVQITVKELESGKSASVPLKVDPVYPAGFTITDLGPGQAAAINNNGQVIGDSFYWANGIRISIGDLPAQNVYEKLIGAADINDAGQIAGIVRIGPDPEGFRALVPAVWTNGVTKDYGLAPFGNIKAINNSGSVIGHYGHGEFIADSQRNGAWIFNFVPAGSWGEALNINDKGQIVGDYDGIARMWENVIPNTPWLNSDIQIVQPSTDLGPGTARAINNHSQIVGDSGGHAVLWENSVMTDLGAGVAYSLNLYGQVVGVANDRPFFWQSGVRKDLQDLIPSGSGWVLKTAVRINNHAQIVGNGTINGQDHVYLLTPTP